MMAMMIANYRILTYAKCGANLVTYFISLNPHDNPIYGQYYPYFTDEETKTQKRWIMPKTTHRQVAEPRFTPRSVWPQSL